eukprot:m.29233 g.29233  ORF g.29233 m.29233 type:complete len:164 (+) comp4640_c0_seq2:170-661(+)
MGRKRSSRTGTAAAAAASPRVWTPPKRYPLNKTYARYNRKVSSSALIEEAQVPAPSPRVAQSPRVSVNLGRDLVTPARIHKPAEKQCNTPDLLCDLFVDPTAQAAPPSFYGTPTTRDASEHTPVFVTRTITQPRGAAHREPTQTSASNIFDFWVDEPAENVFA